MPNLRIGCVADDFTGASDMASFLVKGGLNTEMIDGIPSIDWRPSEETQAIVIALKSRTQPVDDAVEDSLACFRWLRSELRAEQLFFKYCSTFDSTSEGNIGPVIDAVLKEFDIPSAVVSPGLPVNGRTVYQGYLFVNGQPLHESSMQYHPLTPMKDSNLCRLIEAQGRGSAGVIPHSILEQGETAVKAHLQKITNSQYLIADHLNDDHAAMIARVFSNHPFITGSSGLAEALARVHAESLQIDNEEIPMISGAGPALVLAGSCSEATRAQLKTFTSEYGGYRLDAEQLNRNDAYVDEVWEWVESQQGRPCIVYSSDDPEQVQLNQQRIGDAVAEQFEKAFAKLAKAAAEAGFTRIVVAGGETSGAVTQALGESRFRVGPSITPGVPIIQPRGMPQMLMALKSGNFGNPNFFLDALSQMSADN